MSRYYNRVLNTCPLYTHLTPILCCIANPCEYLVNVLIKYTWKDEKETNEIVELVKKGCDFFKEFDINMFHCK